MAGTPFEGKRKVTNLLQLNFGASLAQSGGRLSQRRGQNQRATSKRGAGISVAVQKFFNGEQLEVTAVCRRK